METGLKDKPSRIFYIFLVAWGIINLVQSAFTTLHYDEAYYWLWSKYPAWGYFDHPPMIALMIKAGYLIFRNELGVRLLAVLSQTAALSLAWSMLEKKKKDNPRIGLIFILVISVLPVINIYGFIATPDSPLLLFSVIFLFTYGRFLKKQSLQNALILGLSMAGLVYSKYHGVLMIILVLLSNLKLLKSPKFYLASGFALLLFLPHILWQVSNDFPSVRFHLADRANGFDIKNVPEYLLNQLLINNPLMFPVFLWLIFRKNAKSDIERALKFIIAGFLLFFLASAFRYHVEPQWTALITFPMLIIFFNNAEFNSRLSGYLKWTSIIILPIIIFMRLAIMIDFLPVSIPGNDFHKNREWAEGVSRLAGDRTVVFANSYSNVSIYTFYTGKFAHTLDNMWYRKTQFDIWDNESRLHGREVIYIPNYPDYYKNLLSKEILPGGDTINYMILKDFQSIQKNCVVLESNQYIFSRSSSNALSIKIFNPYPFRLNFKHTEFPVAFEIVFLKKGHIELRKRIDLPDALTCLNPGDTVSAGCNFSIDELPEGKYKIAIGSATGILYDAFNSSFKNAVIAR